MINAQMMPSMLPMTGGTPFANYAEFDAHISALAVASISSSQTPNSLPSGDILVLNVSNDGGSMWGTPWGGMHTIDSHYNRVTLHGLPTASIYAQQVSSVGKMLCKRDNLGTQTGFMALTRNGFTSSSYTTYGAARTERILYWDFSLNAAFEMRPFAMTGPFPYYKDMD